MANLLLDTDIDTDCDDVGALAVVHALKNRGETNLLGVICSIPYRECAACAWAVNHACGDPAVPIGLVDQIL